MNRNELTYRQIEERLRAYFSREAEETTSLPGDFWLRIEPRLPLQLAPGERRRWWHARWTQALMSPVAGVAAVVLLVGGLGVFALTQFNVTGAARSIGVGGGEPTPTAAAPAIKNLTGLSLDASSNERGPQGPPGAAGAPGPQGERGAEGPTLGPGWNVISAPAATPAPTPASGRFSVTVSGEEKAGSDTTGRPAIEIVDRQIIATASVSVEVGQVRPALDALRTIAESLGGFVESLSSSGGPEPKNGSVTVRVPRPSFFDALERIKAAGTVLNEQVGTEDVTNTIIDLQARLRSEERKEASFLTLLERTTSVSEVLNVERELGRVRAEIERIEGQLAFIERRVDLATIDVSLSVPGAPAVKVINPPSASVSLEVPDLDASVGAVRGMGVVSNVVLSAQGDSERATLALEVPIAAFASTVAKVEDLGKVTVKEVRQPGGTTVEAGGEAAPDQPKARLDLTLVQVRPVRDSTNYWLVVGALIAGAAALLLLTSVAYRLGRRRTD